MDSNKIADQMGQAALAWIESLTPEQRELACWPAPGTHEDVDEERVRWFYTPTDHGGLTVGAQRPAQQQLLMRLLKPGLSPAAYVTVSLIMGWENVLDFVEDYSASWGRERGRDPGLYYLRIFGDPGSDRAWGWRFGGHHVSLNFLIVDGRVEAMTPFFLGADPASAPGLGGVTIRPLSQVEDLGRRLVQSLSADRLDQALLWPHAPTDIVGGNRPRLAPGDRMLTLPNVWRGRFADPGMVARVEAVSAAAEELAAVTEEGHARLALTAAPQGVAGGDLSGDQQGVLSELVATYTGRVADALVPAVRLAEIHFAWAGSLKAGEPHYYRLQGPGFLAEWDNTQRNVNHAHSVWRDPDADFGLDVLAAHLAQHHAERPR